MISRLELRNFTVFAEAELDFSPQLNVIVGENGTGKTHLLKVMYALMFAAHFSQRHQVTSKLPAHDKIENVFRTDGIWSLAKAGTSGSSNSYATLFLNKGSGSIKIDIISGESNLTLGKVKMSRPIYLPARELLTIYPNFVSLYETTSLEFDETWRDTCVLLGAPLKKNLDKGEMGRMLAAIEDIIGGKLVNQDGRFYVRTKGILIEAPLLAEGHRKLAMLAQLIANGSIQKGSVLFWDEPEANLNAKLIRQIAQIIMVLAYEGVQVFIATHSLFLLKEIEILNVMGETGPVQTRFFGLHSAKDGVQVMQGDTPFDMGTITALEEELQQTDRFLEANDVAREKENAAEAPAKKKKQSSRRKPQ